MNEYEADVAAINELYNQYCLGANSGDLDLFMSLWTDDAIRMGQDIPAAVGKAQIQSHFVALFAQFILKIVIYGETEVQVSVDNAFSWGTATLSLTPKEGGPTAHVNAKWLDVLQRQADGSWKIHRDSVTNDGPPKVE